MGYSPNNHVDLPCGRVRVNDHILIKKVTPYCPNYLNGVVAQVTKLDRTTAWVAKPNQGGVRFIRFRDIAAVVARAGQEAVLDSTSIPAPLADNQDGTLFQAVLRCAGRYRRVWFKFRTWRDRRSQTERKTLAYTQILDHPEEERVLLALADDCECQKVVARILNIMRTRDYINIDINAPGLADALNASRSRNRGWDRSTRFRQQEYQEAMVERFLSVPKVATMWGEMIGRWIKDGSTPNLRMSCGSYACNDFGGDRRHNRTLKHRKGLAINQSKELFRQLVLQERVGREFELYQKTLMALRVRHKEVFGTPS